jgi:hypothetical protein
MKKLNQLALILSVFILVGYLSYQFYQPDKNKQAQQTGDIYVNALQKELGSTLKSAIKDKGPAGAVDFCNLQAQQITNEVNIPLNENITVRRYSDMPRNVKNTAGEYEMAAIGYFKDHPDQKSYLQKVESNSETKIFNYYKPIYTQTLCLNCHGPKEQINDEVLAIINERYPTDRATGYKEGDLRGVFKVQIPAQELE